MSPYFGLKKMELYNTLPPSVESLFGFKNDEIIGKKIYEFHPDENAETWKEMQEDFKVKKSMYSKKINRPSPIHICI